MSLHLNFEPHSHYMGWAIKHPQYRLVDADGYINELNGNYRKRWSAYTDNGNTYRVDELQAGTLAELKQKIREYEQTMAERGAEIRARLEARLKAEREAKP